MTSVSERRLAENQVMFRKPNQKVSRGFAELKQVAIEENQIDQIPDIDVPILFYCECSDEKCRKRIELKQSEYEDLHQNSSQFVLLPGHSIPSIERIVQSTDNYIVVEKFNTPPKDATSLNKTGLNNSEAN